MKKPIIFIVSMILLLVLYLSAIYFYSENRPNLPNWYTNDWFAQYKREIVEMEHPFEDIDKVFPFIETWDEVTSISAGIRWVRVKDKRTDAEYKMAQGTTKNQWLFKKHFLGYHGEKFLEKFVRWHFTGDLPGWLEIAPYEIRWRERELKELKERRYICD